MSAYTLTCSCRRTSKGRLGGGDCSQSRPLQQLQRQKHRHLTAEPVLHALSGLPRAACRSVQRRTRLGAPSPSALLGSLPKG